MLEVPSGYMSDRLGRRLTLIAAAMVGFGGAALLAVGDSFLVFAIGQVYQTLARDEELARRV